MARLFIFAVGGTGARVLRSFTMLLASGLPGFDSSTEIVPIIIDHDRECGDKRRAVNALDCYNAINRALYPAGQAFNDNFFMTRVTPLGALGGGAMNVPNQWCLDFGVDGGHGAMKFSDYIGYNTIVADANLQTTLGLLRALYDTSDDNSPTAELNLNLKVGFKGKPNIGTVVFNEIGSTQEFGHFLGQCSEDDKVFIIGSLFGGTGSSGIPEIVKAIRNSGQPCANVQIGAVLMLPYFKLQPFANGAHDGINTGAINSSMFNAKTKVALGSYGEGGKQSINHLINAIYYVGDEVSCTANAYNEGSTGQVNPAHVAEFVAAQGIVDFWTTDHTGPYEFGTKDDGEAQAFNLESFYDITHTKSLDSLSAFVIAMRYYREVVCGDRNKVSLTASFYSDECFNLDGKLGKGVYADVDNFLGMAFDDKDKKYADKKYTNDWGFYPWLEELSGNQHSLKPYRVRTNGKEMRDVLSHKVYYSHGVAKNPVRDENMSDKMNTSSKKKYVDEYNDTNFFRVLRKVCKEAYNTIK